MLEIIGSVLTWRHIQKYFEEYVEKNNSLFFVLLGSKHNRLEAWKMLCNRKHLKFTKKKKSHPIL